MAQLDALRKDFREGRREEAIAACETILSQRPDDAEALRLGAAMHAAVRGFARSLELLRSLQARGGGDAADLLFNIALCERGLKDYGSAARSFRAYAAQFPKDPEGWAGLAECQLQLADLAGGIESADRALALARDFVPAWTIKGNCQKAMGRFDEAAASFTRAMELAPQLAELRLRRAEAHEGAARLEEAVADYRAALALRPSDDQSLKQVTSLLLQMNRGPEAIALCKDVLKACPDSIAARLGAEWLLSQMVPLWHVPMMNEEERNRSYYEGLKAVVKPDMTVFEVGTGSGLVSMMAARLGARKVVSCEAVRVVAETAARIVARNGLQDRVTVLAKPSYEVQLGKDLPERADVLVHEIFSSELLGEHVLPALEDAKARLLKPGGIILPGVASMMAALVGGEELGTELYVGESFGFDLSEFNAINPKKRPLYREDLPRVLLSEPVEAFRFDFNRDDRFPAGKKRLAFTANASGRCWGVVQWIRFEFGPGIAFENHPSRVRAVASWQQAVYRFDPPLDLRPGAVVTVDAMHDRSRPWFELAPHGV